jgi:hypothetical protein
MDKLESFRGASVFSRDQDISILWGANSQNDAEERIMESQLERPRE